MTNNKKYQAELCERAVRMVLDNEWLYGSRWEAICSVALKLGLSAESVRKRMHRFEIDNGARGGD